MPFHFTRECAGDLGIIASNNGTEYMAAICFFRASGGYPCFNIAVGGEPVIFNTLPEALNHMIHLAEMLLAQGLPSKED